MHAPIVAHQQRRTCAPVPSPFFFALLCSFFFNYLRYLDLVSHEERREMYMLLLFSAFATTISMFLHTLKFRGYIGPKTSFLIYMARSVAALTNHLL